VAVGERGVLSLPLAAAACAPLLSVYACSELDLAAPVPFLAACCTPQSGLHGAAAGLGLLTPFACRRCLAFNPVSFSN
jgi:hypothetical protein